MRIAKPRGAFKETLKRATNFQKAKEFDKATPEFEAAYAHHLDMVRNADYDLGARNGLKSTAFAYHPTSALADGYSMVLAKAGHNRELVAFAERYFRDYAAPYNKGEGRLRKRMEKARNSQYACYAGTATDSEASTDQSNNKKDTPS